MFRGGLWRFFNGTCPIICVLYVFQYKYFVMLCYVMLLNSRNESVVHVKLWSDEGRAIHHGDKCISPSLVVCHSPTGRVRSSTTLGLVMHDATLVMDSRGLFKHI